MAACNGTEYFMASWVAIVTIEKFGRRKLLLCGAAGQAFSMMMLAISNAKIQNSAWAVCAAVFLFVFKSLFAVGWLGMTWLYPVSAQDLITSSIAMLSLELMTISPIRPKSHH